MYDPQKEIERLNQEVENYRQEMQKVMKERSEYIRVSAHQMKSPLATISFSLETLLAEYAGRLSNKQLRIIESIKRNTDTLQNLISDILELEKIRTGKVELEEVDFVDICTEVAEEIRDKVQEKDLYFELNLPHKLLITRGHQIGLKQALFNLLENAVKYSYRNGAISLTVGYDENESTITCIVKDNGIGIPEEEQQKIFEEFYRAPNAKRYDRAGTGFGMVIVKEIVDFCNGKIRIYSEVNKGTRVTLMFPLLRVEERVVTPQEKRARRKKIVVIGGVAAGPKAASRARRLDPNAEITLFEKGYFLAYAGCALTYYLSGHLKSQRDLSVALSGFQGASEFFRSVKGIEVKNLSEVIKIDRSNKEIQYRDLLTDRVYTAEYDVLIIATGGNPIIPNIEGRDLKNIFPLRGIHDAEQIKYTLTNYMAKNIVILGGGLIGVEISEAFTVSGARVTIVEKQDQILSFLDHEMAALVEKHLEHKGIMIIKNQTAKAFLGRDTVEAVQLQGYQLPADLVVMAAGVKPNVELAKKAGVKIGSTGAVVVNDYLQTSDPDIYAAGDCVESRHVVTEKPFYLPLGSIANRQGRVAGTNAVQKRYTFSPVTGTIIIKVFDYHIAKTGLSEKEAKQYGFDPICCFVPDYDREHYIHGAEIINIKMVACRKTRKLLGVQIVGKGDVAKRIDIAAIVISKKGYVDDIASVDLGYAPLYSNAMGAIIVTAHVLQNKMEGLFEGITAEQVKDILQNQTDNYLFLDVRSPQEYSDERIPGFDLIPLENLRRRIDEIPSSKRIILVSGTGSRAYQASLILRAHGLDDVRILEGGLKMWPYQIHREQY
ncbi:MAG: FAD-dependent oxidoreductase [Spirochaetota bacterium]